MNEVTRKTPRTRQCIELESRVKVPVLLRPAMQRDSHGQHAGRDPPRDSSGILQRETSAPGKSFGFSCWARKATCLPRRDARPVHRRRSLSCTVSTLGWSSRLLSLNRDFRPGHSVTDEPCRRIHAAYSFESFLDATPCYFYERLRKSVI